jgi:hypothetical protein
MGTGSDLFVGKLGWYCLPVPMKPSRRARVRSLSRGLKSRSEYLQRGLLMHRADYHCSHCPAISRNCLCGYLNDRCGQTSKT